jgi:hypothetical protein
MTLIYPTFPELAAAARRHGRASGIVHSGSVANSF